jgi:hypothetical protein
LKGQTAGIISTVIVVVIIVSGFIPYVVALKVVTTPYGATETTSIPYVGVQTMTEQSPTTGTSQVYSINQYTINCSNYVWESAMLSSQWNVQVTFSASDTVDAYLLNSQQYSNYHGGTTSDYESALTGQSSGTFGLNVAVSDTYYLVIYNLHTGLFCVGGEKVAIYSATGTATYEATAYYPVTTTETLYSVSSFTTTLTSTSTKTCTVGWLQAAISSC